MPDGFGEIVKVACILLTLSGLCDIGITPGSLGSEAFTCVFSSILFSTSALVINHPSNGGILLMDEFNQFEFTTVEVRSSPGKGFRTEISKSDVPLLLLKPWFLNMEHPTTHVHPFYFFLYELAKYFLPQ